MDEAMNNSLVLEGNSARQDPTTTMNDIRPDRHERPDRRDQIMQRKDLTLPRYQGKLPTTRAYNPNRKYEKTEQQAGKEDKINAIDLSNVTCFRCRNKGHLARNCTLPNSLNYQGPSFQDSSGKQQKSLKKQ